MFKLVLSLFVLLNVVFNVYCMSFYRMDSSDGADDLYSITIGSKNETGHYSIGDNVTLVCRYNQVLFLSEFRFTASYCDNSFLCKDILEFQGSGHHMQLTDDVFMLIRDPLSDAFHDVYVRNITAPTLFNITIAGATKDVAGGYKCRLDYVDPSTNVTRFTPTLYRHLDLKTG